MFSTPPHRCRSGAISPPISNLFEVLRGAIAAFQAAEEDGFEEGAIDEGFGVRALREAFKKFGISVQRYWNGAVS